MLLARLGDMDSLADFTPADLTDLVVVFLDPSLVGDDQATTNLSEAGFPFVDSMAIYLLKPITLPNGTIIWELAIVTNLFNPATVAVPQPIAPPRIVLTVAQLSQTRVAHALFKDALPNVVFPAESRFVEITADQRPVMLDLRVPVVARVMMGAAGAAIAREIQPPVTNGVSVAMTQRAQTKDYIQHADKIQRLEGIMSPDNFRSLVGDISMSIPVWGHVVGRAKVEVTRILGPKQCFSDSHAANFLTFKYGSAEGKTLPAHISWSFFASGEITDTMDFLAAADRFNQLTRVIFGDDQCRQLQLLFERLRVALTPDPDRCFDTELGVADAIDIVNHGLSTLYNDSLLDASASPAERWLRVVSSLPTSKFWSNLSTTHARARLLSLVNTHANKRKRSIGGDVDPTERCHMQDSERGCFYGLKCKRMHDPEHPKVPYVNPKRERGRPANKRAARG